MKESKRLVFWALIIVRVAVTTSPVMADERLNSDFRIAAISGEMNRVEKLLKNGAEVNSRGPAAGRVPAGMTALMGAATNNHLEVVKLLISHGANINQADDGGGTALIYAVWKGNKKVVSFLLENGADVYAKTRDGRTPLSIAKQAGHTEIVKMLKATAMK